jgi:hypothetical protein
MVTGSTQSVLGHASWVWLHSASTIAVCRGMPDMSLLSKIGRGEEGKSFDISCK